MMILSFCAQAVGDGVHEGRGRVGLMMMMVMLMLMAMMMMMPMMMVTTTKIMITTIKVEWAALSPPKPNLSLLGATFKVEKIEKNEK